MLGTSVPHGTPDDDSRKQASVLVLNFCEYLAFLLDAHRDL